MAQAKAEAAKAEAAEAEMAEVGRSLLIPSSASPSSPPALTLQRRHNLKLTPKLLYCLGAVSRLSLAAARTLGVSVGCGGGRGVHGVWVGRGCRVGGHGATLCATMNNDRIVVGAVLFNSTIWRVRAGMR